MRISTILLLVGCAFYGSTQTDTSDRIALVEKTLSPAVRFKADPTWTIEERMEHYKITGVSIAVISDFKLDWAKGYGFADSEQKTPVTTETAFQAASISKTINAVAFLHWATTNNIDLDQDINQLLKSWEFPYDQKSGGKTISPRLLLSHMAGTSVHGFPGFKKPEDVATTLQILNGEKPSNTKAVQSLFPPGEKFKYSGGGTTITELILKDQTQMAYEDYLKEKVFSPLGMDHSFYPRDVRTSVAKGHFKSGKQRSNGYNTYPQLGAAALWTTPTDLSKLIIELQLARAGKSDKVLDQETATLMTTPFMDGQTQALGTFVETIGTKGYFTHGGSNEGFKCAYYGSLEGGSGVIVMVNSDEFEIINEIIRSVSEVYNWDLKRSVIKDMKLELTREQMKKYIGEYRSTKDHSRILRVSIKKGKLLVQEPKKWGVYLTGTDTDTFIAPDINPVPILVFKRTGKSISKIVIEQDGEHEWVKEK